jgi:hypothetical protein
LRGNDDLALPVRQCGEGLDKDAPQRFRFKPLNRRGFIEAIRVDQQSDALFAPILERRHVQRLICTCHLRAHLRSPMNVHAQGVGQPDCRIGPIHRRISRQLGVERDDSCSRRTQLCGIRPPHHRQVCPRIGLNLGAHPPNRVGREADIAIEVEAISRLDQPDIGLLQKIRINLSRTRPETLRNGRRQWGKGSEQAVPSGPVAAALPGVDKPTLFLGRQHVRATNTAVAMREGLVHRETSSMSLRH